MLHVNPIPRAHRLAPMGKQTPIPRVKDAVIVLIPCFCVGAVEMAESNSQDSIYSTTLANAHSLDNNILLDQLFSFVQLPNFDIASDAFATLKDLLTRHSDLSSVYLSTLYEKVVPAV